MKVVYVNDVVYAYAIGDSSANGGAERQQWLFARALAATGWSVTVGVREALKTGEQDFCCQNDQTGGTGEVQVIGGGLLLRSQSLQEHVRYLPQHLILTYTPVRPFSVVPDGGRSIVGDLQEPIEFLSSIAANLPILSHNGVQKRI
jgi:hypothetical protein